MTKEEEIRDSQELAAIIRSPGWKSLERVKNGCLAYLVRKMVDPEMSSDGWKHYRAQYLVLEAFFKSIERQAEKYHSILAQARNEELHPNDDLRGGRMN